MKTAFPRIALVALLAACVMSNISDAGPGWLGAINGVNAIFGIVVLTLVCIEGHRQGDWW